MGTIFLKGRVQLLYITPESIILNRLYRNMLLSPLYKEKLAALVIDEAHCVKFWGDLFQQTFALICDLRRLIPSNVKLLALTATATIETYQCVVKRLSMDNPVLVSISPERSNIICLVRPKTSLEYLSHQLYQEFCENKVFPKTILFVRKFSDCSDLCRESLVQSLLPLLATLMLLNIEKLKCSQVSILAKKESR